MKSFVVFGFLISAAVAQRPSFAGSSAKGYPELANRFRDTQSSDNASTTIANRIGADVSTTSTTTIRIPIDARGDEELVRRVQDWPRENQPFWFLNSQHIEEHRDPQSSGTNQPQQILSRSGAGGSYGGGTRSPTPVPQRSSFLGSSSRQ